LPFSTILITGDASVQIAVEAMKAGASDLITKPFTSEVLVQAVRQALEKRRASAHDAQIRERHVLALSGLTSRERDVLRGIMAGKTNKMIARDHRISPRTVEAHRAALMRKTGAATQSDLVRGTLLAGFDADTEPAGREVVRQPARNFR
jgi:two-component system response regulator FixJ